jgi:NAD(P)-dependent dehydrogenase (short-subunit alcohol dehydrogenase family)
MNGMEMSGHAALVTGGGSGLGAASARRLAAEGMRVAILDRDGEAARRVAEEVGGIGLAGDVTEPAAVAAALAAARDRHGPVRVCVSCAGIAPAARVVGRDGPASLEDFERVLRVNLTGTFNVLRLAAAEMVELDPVGVDGERGVIVNTASVAAFEGQVGQCAYAASKGGVAALTLPAARELARFGIRVLTIAPGLMATPMLAGFPAEVRESLAAQVPFPRRLGHPEEYAALLAHLVTNALMNGEVVRLDGAIRLAPR